MSTDDQNTDDDSGKKAQIRYADPAPKDAEEQTEHLKKRKTMEELQDEDHKMDHRTHGQILDEDDDTLNQEERNIRIRWEAIKSEYRETYPNLTKEDLEFETGNYADMTERIAKKTDRNRDDVQDEIRNWNLKDKNWE